MFLKSLMKKVPYIGNLVPAKYLVTNTIGGYLDKIMPCWSVRLDPSNNMEGLILTNSDLSEAHFRFVKYYDALTPEERELRLGSIRKRSFVTKRPGSRPVELMLAYFCQEGGERTGYLFATNDMVRIVEKSKKLDATIKRPTWFHRCVMRINMWLGNISKE